jgi:hypothetical protein
LMADLGCKSCTRVHLPVHRRKAEQNEEMFARGS